MVDNTTRQHWFVILIPIKNAFNRISFKLQIEKYLISLIQVQTSILILNANSQEHCYASMNLGTLVI